MEADPALRREGSASGTSAKFSGQSDSRSDNGFICKYADGTTFLLFASSCAQAICFETFRWDITNFNVA